MTEENTLKILCPFCNEPYTAEMLIDLEEGNDCDTCGGDSADLTVEIKCANCKKIVYKKEGKGYDF